MPTAMPERGRMTPPQVDRRVIVALCGRAGGKDGRRGHVGRARRKAPRVSTHVYMLA